ncbi:MAG: hypothetical protein EBT73_02780 [Actinobacteria bacterium]|nr:hypothetical protein [Actinomycetota bacterium]
MVSFHCGWSLLLWNRCCWGNVAPYGWGVALYGYSQRGVHLAVISVVANTSTLPTNTCSVKHPGA